jgi:hypothetical protein
MNKKLFPVLISRDNSVPINEAWIESENKETGISFWLKKELLLRISFFNISFNYIKLIRDG